MPNTKFCLGISDISDSYTGFIIDTWGVLHDGEKVFDHVNETLKELRDRNKFILFMSNSELRADKMAQSLTKKGLMPDSYSKILTSGEYLFEGFKNQKDDFFQGIGRSCYLIGGERSRKFLEELSIDVVDKIEQATFLLVSGWDNFDADLGKYEDILRESVRRRLKNICINADSHAILGLNYNSGAAIISKRIQELGGVVNMVGKPYKSMFHHCIKILHQNDIYPGQTVMVGDSMAHDIIGATMVNMDTCLIKNGMHSPVFKNAATPADVNKALNMLVMQYNNIRPTYLVDRLKWGKALPDRKHRRK